MARLGPQRHRKKKKICLITRSGLQCFRNFSVVLECSCECEHIASLVAEFAGRNMWYNYNRNHASYSCSLVKHNIKHPRDCGC